MEGTTEAIVLHLSKYTDKASILHAYTKESGRIQYIVYNSQRKTAGYGMFAPLSHIEIESTGSPANSNFHRLRSARLIYVPRNTQTDMTRRSIALFIAEMLYHTLRHPLADENLFDYLTQLTKNIDNNVTPENIHLQFLLQFTEYLGIMPDLEPTLSTNEVLDMQTGRLTSLQPLHKDYFTLEETQLLQTIAQAQHCPMNRQMRQSLLGKLNRYYEIHLPDFITPKTLDILTQVFA
ncbi:MAG: recombination protein O N-terminal domain-containing protein [Paludibacter sp.]|nr:recombination protein O N-terminal domain-containing protein [Bacteroidales bacterium]MCM1068514.1 recombination protein O N-terminal domain-containing protein [Prevotella sp.]MCM1353468.1 recombination protein O N-terminal domain-containing protein [Bacteroides sp.]MCM1442629.1 recombination protein O N-terminal domain-containing protein [Muribaculum sp.]MCM1481474.1 recombination protein O N-terminal domain-containing protein [Paludibacter sp.]